MSATRQLLKVARLVLYQVLNDLNKQIVMLDTEIVADSLQILQTIDDYWRGEDAEQFKQTLQNTVQNTQEVILDIQTTATVIQTAHDIIVDADRSVAEIMATLREQYEDID